MVRDDADRRTFFEAFGALAGPGIRWIKSLGGGRSDTSHGFIPDRTTRYYDRQCSVTAPALN
jgi:hypothetical protein